MKAKYTANWGVQVVGMILQTRSSLPYVLLKIISKIYLYSFFFISALYRYFTKQRTIKIIAAARLTFQPIENPGGVYFKETVCSPEGTFTPRKASPIRHVFTSLPSTFTFHPESYGCTASKTNDGEYYFEYGVE